MTNDKQTNALCAQIEEQMAEILDGTAAEELYDHIADCDACRDARHDAEQAAELCAAAGADYRPPADLEQRVLAALDAQSAQASVESTASPVATAPEAAPDTLRLPGAEPQAATPEQPKTELATEPTAESKTELKPEPAGDALPDPMLHPTAGARPDSVLRRPRLLLLSGKRRWLAAGAVAGALAAAAAGILVLRSSGQPGSEAEGDGWRGKVMTIANAAGKEQGLDVCAPDGESCRALGKDQTIPAGSLLVTDERTRAHLEMADGTQLVLDRSTRLALSGELSRRARLDTGAIVADVAHRVDRRARFELPRGHVEVLGTKFALRASEDSAAVDVSRGAVELADEEGRKVTVRAGEEGRVFRGVAPYVSSAPALGEAIAWSESTMAEHEQEDVVARGLGELKAKKPSSDQELSGAVTLTSHKLKVRIAGAIARTEVDETFTNHTDDVLEGIYRFPIPPDAKIERLALEVDGKLEEGAFVDRDRASAIWRGAIVTAAPQRRQQVREEIVWVPGPWKDPALLEWQRGGRFELRIFPIPKRSARRVVLAYTQVLAPTGGVRRYNYPLAHDPSGSTKVDDFQVDAQVRGHDAAFGVRTQGYQLRRSNAGGADALEMAARDFVPSGDLTIEFALPNRDAELTAWAYRPAPSERKAPKNPSATGSAEPEAPRADDDKAYVAIALRPKLPRRREDAQRTFAIVVDSSRSMFGESYRRASLVAVKTIRELDPSDRFALLACDTDCRALAGGLSTPGPKTAQEARSFLESIVPEGGSDVTAAIRNARASVSSESGRELRVVYIGDGTPTVGPIRPAYVTRAVQDSIPPGAGTVTAVAVGADSDLDTLAALARGGGGVVLPFVPGQSTAEAAYAVLGATYGNALRDVRVELPAGLTEVAPKQLDTIISGSEQMLVARMDKSELEGTVVVRGTLGKQSFEQRYPLKLAASEAKGNAFVPRMFAATRINDLERDPDASAKKEAIRLSSEFDVASRYTSLLVLESPAMFKAFGLDNTRSGHEWSGEEEAQATESGGLNELGDGDGFAFGGSGGAKQKMRSTARKSSDLRDNAFEFGPAGASPAPKPVAPPRSAPPMEAKKESSAALEPNHWDELASRSPRRRPMVPMRRIWERKGSIEATRSTPNAVTSDAISSAQRELDQNPNKRDAVKKLYVLHALAGDIEQASSVAERWSEKEPLDPDALTARADLAARNGDRELAIRVLGSVVDVRPGDIAAQKRLARLHRWAGRPAVGCRHAIAISQLRGGDSTLLAEAVSCARQTGESRMAEDMLSSAESGVRKAAQARIPTIEKQKDELSGDLRVEASWIGAGHDLDIALLDPDGNRVSWLGAPTRSVISALDVASTSRESLALRGAKTGEYVIEIVRASGNGSVRGELVITVPGGARRTVPFVLDGARQTVGIAKITMQSRLVPLGGPVW
jgi:hypothetical protein